MGSIAVNRIDFLSRIEKEYLRIQTESVQKELDRLMDSYYKDNPSDIKEDKEDWQDSLDLSIVIEALKNDKKEKLGFLESLYGKCFLRSFDETIIVSESEHDVIYKREYK